MQPKSVLLDPSVIIQKAASRVRGDRLNELYTLCETQKTVSTRRLYGLIEKLRQSDLQDGKHFYVLADYLRG